MSHFSDTNHHHRSSKSKMALAPPLTAARTLAPLVLFLLSGSVICWRPWPNTRPNSTDFLYGGSKKYEGSSEFVHLKYHMGPVLTANITVYPIWYGTWQSSQKRIIRAFIGSISAVDSKPPSVAGWWKTIQLYTDQTGNNISQNVLVGEEKNDRFYSHGKSLTRLSVQSVIKSAVTSTTRPLPINPKSGVYLLLTSSDVYVQDFCNNVCGFHYFTFPSIVGYTLPYAWVGNSAKFCPGVCAYPFAVPDYIPAKAVKPPNGDVGVDGMISVIAHEIAELSTNPLVNAWYAGQDPIFPVEIADLCEGIYGTGGGGSYTGQMMTGRDGATFNMNGIRRRFLVQWVWNHLLNYCTGPNALDQ
ncbi:protein EXORDIUM-like 3 [Primulina huaijiensis]|uniref:protein EXORDIUM-like 3 n=1 Tax=Primulina huaijiensis TaxID=1492673 RepID=UPI003CC75E8A